VVNSKQWFIADGPSSNVGSLPLCRRNPKLASCSRISDVCGKTAPSVKTTAPAVSGVSEVTAAPYFVQYVNSELGKADSETGDDAKKVSGVECLEARTNGSGALESGVNSHPQLQTVSTTVACSSVDVSSPEGSSSESSSSTERIEQLRRMIDRATGQLYTIAEVYLMMLKPSRVPLEYDWVDTAAAGDVTMGDVSGRLQKLVSIAKAAFAASTAKPLVS